jgi:mono/diheme cytochrome c family protein
MPARPHNPKGIAVAIGAVLILALAESTGADAQDAEKGRALAQSLCANCHMQPGQGEKHGPMGLPSFAAIAKRPGQDHETIVKWLRSRPSMMPDHHLTWDEADALAEFIMSLRTAK